MKLTLKGWVFILLLLYIWSKTKTGYHMIYYSLVLILVLLVVGQSTSINKILVKQQEE